MPSPASRLLRSALLTAALIIATSLAAAPASASNGKRFILTMAVPAGSTQTVTATFLNPSDAKQQLGSADLTPPPGLTVTAATVPRGSAGLDGRTVELRDLALRPGEQVVVTLTVRAGCTGSTAPWTVVAKQANDFNGTGNEIALWESRSTLTTPLTGGCKLVWKRQPTNAQVGALISGTAYQPAQPKPEVVVATADGTPVTTATGDVALSFGLKQGSGVLVGGTSALAPPNGATFSSLRIDDPSSQISGAGAYSLVATVTSGPYAGLSATSKAIRLSELVEECAFGALCTSSLTRSATTFTVNALPFGDTPFLTLSADAGLRLRDTDCAQSWTDYDSATALFEVTSTDRQKTISVTIAKRIVQLDPDNGAPRVDLCFASPEPFATKVPGTSGLRFDWDLDGTLDPVHAGLLPDCSSTKPPPCVSQRKKVAGGNGYIEARLPAALGDPAMRT